MSDPLSEDSIVHPLNETLLGEAATLKADRQLLQDRMDKLDQSKSGVSASVYERVRSDYLSKIHSTSERLAVIKKSLESEQKSLLEKQALVERHLKQHRETIEEAELRHSLGEFSSEQLEEIKSSQNREMGRLEDALKNLAAGLQRHRDLFSDIASLPVSPPSKPRETPREPPRREAPPVPPVEAPPPVVATAPVPDPDPESPEATCREELPQETTRIKLEPAATEKVSMPPPLEPVQAKTAEILVLENGKVAQMVPLDKTIHIGRSPSNDIVLKEPKVSRKHAEIHCTAGKYILLDLESSNGTFIGGKKITEQALQSNDEIVIGNTKMIFKV